MEVRHGVKGGICADHDDVAVCEVQKQDNTVDHAVAKCHQRVDRACLEAIEQLREQQGQVHVDTSLSFSIADTRWPTPSALGTVHPMSAVDRYGEDLRTCPAGSCFIRQEPTNSY